MLREAKQQPLFGVLIATRLNEETLWNTSNVNRWSLML
jgi:hypothetical protein